MMYWRVNDDGARITRELILTGLDLDELHALTLWNLLSNDLTEMARQVRWFALNNQLKGWSCAPVCILLEIENEPCFPFDQTSTLDGCG